MTGSLAVRLLVKILLKISVVMVQHEIAMTGDQALSWVLAIAKLGLRVPCSQVQSFKNQTY